MFQNNPRGSGFNAGGGFGGGGFPSGDGFASPSAGGDKKKFRFQNIAPVSASDVSRMTFDDSTFHLGNNEVSQVTVVGTIVSVEKSQTCNTYVVEDATGNVTVKHWNAFDGEEEEEEGVSFEEGALVRVFAQVRSFQKTISLNALQVREISDVNEVTVHILECMKFKLVAEAKSNNTQKGNMTMDHSMGNMGMDNMGMDPVQTQVWQSVESCSSIEGMSVDEIRSSLKGLNVNQIKKALDFLSNEGHIYSTIDEFHFKSTR